MSEPKTYVAVVDDDESFSRALGRLLRAAGFEPLVYSSAEAFLQDFTCASTNCLVLDIELGGMSGLELCRECNRLGRNTPVIFVTAHDEPEIREKALRLGCAAYLPKPVAAKLLIETIRAALEPNRR